MVTLLNQTPKCEWYMTMLLVMNVNQIDICYDEIGLCAQNIDTILGSRINTIGSTCVIT